MSVRAGWVLLEMIVALAIFAMTAMAVLGSIDRGLRAAERISDDGRAADLARSTMAKLEGGLGTIQSLSGPVPPWEPPLESEGSFEAFAPLGETEMAQPGLWEVEIDSMRSEFEGLTHVTVTVVKRVSENSEELASSFTLHQLVRLAEGEEDLVGEVDALSAPASGGTR